MLTDSHLRKAAAGLCPARAFAIVARYRMESSVSEAAPRIVLDTNVCLALFLYADPACAALRGLLGWHRAVANAATRGEWLRVLQQGRFPFQQEHRLAAAAAFDQCTLQLDAAPRGILLPRCRDPDDQKFLELARDAGAVALVTRDRELLRLARRTRRTAGFDVLTPEALAGGPGSVAL